MPKPVFTLEEIVKNRSYFIRPKHLQNAFFEYLKGEFQKNKITKNRGNKEKLKVLREEAFEKLEHLKITNAKKVLMMKQFNAALRRAAIQVGINTSFRKAAALKLKLKRLRRLLMLQKMRRLRIRRKIKAIEEFEDMMEMHKLQLERDYEELIKKLEKEKRKYNKRKSNQKPNVVASNMSENIIDLCDILSDLLEIDRNMLAPKLEKNGQSLKNTFLYLELTLKSDVENAKEFDKKMLDIVDGLEEIYNFAKKEISENDIKKAQILDNWCKQIEINLLNWLNNGHVEKLDKENKEKIIQNLTTNLQHTKPQQGISKFFTPLKAKAQLLTETSTPMFNKSIHRPYPKPPFITTTK